MAAPHNYIHWPQTRTWTGPRSLVTDRDPADGRCRNCWNLHRARIELNVRYRRNCTRCNTLVALGVGLMAVPIALFGTLGVVEWAGPALRGWPAVVALIAC